MKIWCRLGLIFVLHCIKYYKVRYLRRSLLVMLLLITLLQQLNKLKKFLKLILLLAQIVITIIAATYQKRIVIRLKHHLATMSLRKTIKTTSLLLSHLIITVIHHLMDSRHHRHNKINCNNSSNLIIIKQAQSKEDLKETICIMPTLIHQVMLTNSKKN